MINIFILKENKNKEIDIIATDINSTITEAKAYYKTNNVVLSSENTAYKVLYALGLNGYDIIKTATSFTISRENKKIAILDLCSLHNLGLELNLYKNSKRQKSYAFTCGSEKQEKNIIADLAKRGLKY